MAQFSPSLLLSFYSTKNIGSFFSVSAGNSQLIETFEDTIEKDIKKVVGIISRETANHKDSNGATLLHKAVIQGDADIVKKLIKLNADVNATDNDGITPLMTAASFGYDDIIQILILSGADVNKKSLSGDSALSLAMKKDFHSTVAFLVVVADADFCGVWSRDGKSGISRLKLFDNPWIIEMMAKTQGWFGCMDIDDL